MTSHSRAAAYRTPDPVGERERAAVYRTRRELPERLTWWEAFWYVLGNFPLAAMYFAKIPYKKAQEESGLMTVMTRWERFWYYLGCVPFGQMYFLKIPAKMAIVEMQP